MSSSGLRVQGLGCLGLIGFIGFRARIGNCDSGFRVEGSEGR